MGTASARAYVIEFNPATQKFRNFGVQGPAHGAPRYVFTSSVAAFGGDLPPVLAAFLRSHPDVNIDLRERLSNDIIRAVTEGQTDIGIVAGSVRTENLETLPYRQDALVLVVPHKHPLAEQPSVAFEETLDLLHVGLHEASAIHAFLRQACERLSRTLQLRIQVSSFEVACRLIEEGVGVGVLPASAASRHARHMAIRIVPLSDAWSLRAMQICVRNFDTLPVFARDLVDLLTADAQAAEVHTALNSSAERGGKPKTVT